MKYKYEDDNGGDDNDYGDYGRKGWDGGRGDGE